MGLISNVLMLSAWLGIGYYACKNDTCHSSAEKIMALEQKYAKMPAQQGIVGPKELSIDYIVDEKHGFKGYVFTDNGKGTEGVLVRSPLFGKDSYYLSYAAVEGGVPTPTEKIPLIHGTDVGYVSAPAENTLSGSALSSWWRKVRNTVDEVVDD